MTISRIRKAALLGCVAITLQFGSACSPAEVLEGARQLGVELTNDQADAVSSHLTPLTTPAQIEAHIRVVWAGTGQAERAVRIARCESTLQADPPHNNRYRGVFQMGPSEWRTYGRGGNIYNARHNIEAAHRYWVAAGGWGPWECRG